MKVRGTLKITKDVVAPITGGSTAHDGLYGVTDDNGILRWSDLVIPSVDINRNYPKDSLVLDQSGNAFISIVNSANGGAITDPNVWNTFGGGGAPVSYIQLGPYPPGTKLEDIMLACCYPNSVRNLVLSGYGDTIPANTPIVDPTFAWQVSGNPTSVILSDNVGILTGIDVTGLTSYTSNVTYNYGDGATVIWTITATGGSTASDSIKWVAAVVHDNIYYGTMPASQPNTTPPTEAEILAGNSIQISSDPELILPGGSSWDDENYFIAIPETQKHAFTSWLDMSPHGGPYQNTGTIGTVGSWSAWEDHGTIVVSGTNYHVYISGTTGSVDSVDGFKLF